MGWNIETVKVDNDPSRSLQSQIDQRALSTANITANKGTFDVVGMNAQQIPVIRASIQMYVNNINQYIDGIDTKASSVGAFKGDEVSVAVENYILKLKEYCKNLTSQLMAFSDQIELVYKNWVMSTERMASAINSSSSSLNSSKYVSKQ